MGHKTVIDRQKERFLPREIIGKAILLTNYNRNKKTNCLSTKENKIEQE